jgi:hypothetical protein
MASLRCLRDLLDSDFYPQSLQLSNQALTLLITGALLEVVAAQVQCVGWALPTKTAVLR